MNTKIVRRILSCLILLLSTCNIAFAQFEEGRVTSESEKIVGNSIAINGVVNKSYVNDPSITSKKCEHIIWLKFQDEISLKANCSISVDLNIQTTDFNNVTTTESKTLSIEFKVAAATNYNTKAFLQFKDKKIVNVTVAANPVITGGANEILQMVLENEMIVTKYYQLGSGVATFGADTNNLDRLKVSWVFPTTTNNNITQLEWAWVEDEMIGYYNEVSSTVTVSFNSNKLFNQNSTRVDLESSNYEIPLLYPGRGILFYRVRPALRKNDDNIIVGNWTLANPFVFAGHDSLLNWQSSTSFAENGKRKSVIQYFDGSLRNRQVVTKDNETGNTIVGETIYDLQGRPNIQILPTPTINNVIQYFKNFNRFEGQLTDEDPSKYFDLSLKYSKCNASPRLDSNYGNAKYYSINNDWLSTEKKSSYVPNSNGYAYTETRYTDDATKRVKLQGGLGATHKIGSTHDTKYFYGKPAQPELDALFGTEVGDASHYTKNMVQNANGQMSVSYVDMHGRTIATALAGANPENLTAIDTNNNNLDYPKSSSLLTTQLLTPTTNNVIGNSVQSISTILTPTSTVYNFTYKLNPSILKLLNCSSNQVCYDCKYDLEITLRSEECGMDTPIIRRFNNLKLVPTANQCDSSMGFTGEGITTPTKEINFSYRLATGSWIITKTLTINDSAFQSRKDSALKIFLCRTEQQIFDSIYNIVTSETGCGLTPTAITQKEYDSCRAKLGATYDIYKAKYLASISPNTYYVEKELYAQHKTDSIDCASALTKSPRLSTLATLRNQMLGDMIPFNGQYAVDTVRDSSGVADDKRFEAKYNIFSRKYYDKDSSSYITKDTPTFKNPITELGQFVYLDETGNTDVTIHPNPPITPLLPTITPANFTSLFERSWANSLITRHPEYSKLQIAEGVLRPSYEWLDKFTEIETYTEATNFLTPLGTSATRDPFFDLINDHVIKYKARLNHFLIDGLQYDAATNTYNGPSIWQLANSSVLCASIPETDRPGKEGCIMGTRRDGFSTISTLTLDDKDAIWQSFKSMYLSYRNEFVLKYINGYTGATFLTRVEMDSLIADEKILAFANAQDIANQNNWSYWAAAASGDTTIKTTVVTNPSLILETNKCKAQHPYWKAKLLQCEKLDSLLETQRSTDSLLTNTIINSILSSMDSVCQNSKDANHIYGASTVNPSIGGNPTGFEQVINRILSQNGITTLPNNYYCNPFTIDYPKPYNAITVPDTITKTNTLSYCNCEKFQQLKAEIKAAGYDSSSLKSCNTYLLNIYHDSISTPLWNSLKLCSTLTKDGCVWKIVKAGGGGSSYRATNNDNTTLTNNDNSTLTNNEKSINKIIEPMYLRDTGLVINQQQFARPTNNPDNCIKSTISYVQFINATGVNNVQVMYNIVGFCEGCNLIVRNIKGDIVLDTNVQCSENSIILSLPPCRDYTFTIICGQVWMPQDVFQNQGLEAQAATLDEDIILPPDNFCGSTNSNTFSLTHPLDCNCPKPKIDRVKYIAYDADNINLYYTSIENCIQPCKIIIKDVDDNIVLEKELECDVHETILSLKPFLTFKFILECYDEKCGYVYSDVYMLPPHPDCDCPKPTLEATYVNDTDTDNIDVNYSTIKDCKEGCTLLVYDRRGNEVANEFIDCGSNRINLSLPSCEPYIFLIKCYDEKCGYVFSDSFKIRLLNSCECRRPVINAVKYVNTTNKNNILIDYTTYNSCSNNCQIVVTNLVGSVVLSSPVACNSYQQIITLPDCYLYNINLVCASEGCDGLASNKIKLEPIDDCECPKPTLSAYHYNNTGTTALRYSTIPNCNGASNCKILIKDSLNIAIDSLNINCGSGTITINLPICQKYNFVLKCYDDVCGYVYSNNYFLDKNPICNSCSKPQIDSVNYNGFDDRITYSEEYYVYFKIPSGINCKTCKLIVRDSISRDTIQKLPITSLDSAALGKYIYGLNPCKSYLFNIVCPSPICLKIESNDFSRSAQRNCDTCKSPLIHSVTYNKLFNGKYVFHINYSSNKTDCLGFRRCELHIRNKLGSEIKWDSIYCDKNDYTVIIDSLEGYQFYLTCFSTKCNSWLYSNLIIYNPLLQSVAQSL